MAIISPQGVTRERTLKIRVTLSRMLADAETLRLLNNGVVLDSLTKLNDFLYEADYVFTGNGDPATVLRFVAQALYAGQPISNSPLYEISFFDPPRSEIRSIEFTDIPVDPEPGQFFILMEDGTPMLAEDGFPLLTELQA